MEFYKRQKASTKINESSVCMYCFVFYFQVNICATTEWLVYKPNSPVYQQVSSLYTKPQRSVPWCSLSSDLNLMWRWHAQNREFYLLESSVLELFTKSSLMALPNDTALNRFVIGIIFHQGHRFLLSFVTFAMLETPDDVVFSIKVVVF